SGAPALIENELAAARSAASGATVIGTNAGAPRSAANCRRQRFSRLTSTPALRAISVTTAAGSPIAATSRAFSAALQRRRRSTDVMTSMRLMVANLVLATLSYVASSTRKAARPGRIRRSEPSELDQPRFVFVQAKPKLGQPFRQGCRHPVRIRAPLEG